MKALLACLALLILVAPKASAAEPSSAEKTEWLAIQRAAIADPDDSAKLHAFLGLLGRFGDDYVVEGDILMSEEEVQTYLENKRRAALPTPADTAGELIVDTDAAGNRIFWKRPEDRIFSFQTALMPTARARPCAAILAKDLHHPRRAIWQN